MLQFLSVKNYRNLSIPGLKLTSGTTVFSGRNGQGKTNILESIYFLSYGKPFRGAKADCIGWDHDEAMIVGQTGHETLRVMIRRNQETKVLINNKNKSVVDLFGKFVSVLFHPEEIEMVTGAPSQRRAWLDRTLATATKKYLFNLANYQRTLKNKNALLRTGNHSPEEMNVWNRNLTGLGSKIWLERIKFIDELNTIIKSQSRKIAGRSMRIDYSNPLAKTEPKDAEKTYLEGMSATNAIEQRLKVTVFGPHRDDFKFIVEEQVGQSIVEKDIAAFGSRGEQRQGVVILKLTEAAYFNKTFQKPPTILLDDVVSELDVKNRDLLLANLFGRQVIITTTDTSSFGSDVKKRANTLEVDEGKVTPS